jgi:alcohol dehydrogenase (NADP+)
MLLRVLYNHPRCCLQVGAALAELLAEGVVRREQLFITGKLWNSSHNPKDVQPALMKTLQDLGVG